MISDTLQVLNNCSLFSCKQEGLLQKAERRHPQKPFFWIYLEKVRIIIPQHLCRLVYSFRFSVRMVLGPDLFLIFINDLPDIIRSSVLLFADVCVLYRNINSLTDYQILQKT